MDDAQSPKGRADKFIDEFNQAAADLEAKQDPNAPIKISMHVNRIHPGLTMINRALEAAVRELDAAGWVRTPEEREAAQRQQEEL